MSESRISDIFLVLHAAMFKIYDQLRHTRASLHGLDVDVRIIFSDIEDYQYVDLHLD
jgi:hypothetical protein